MSDLIDRDALLAEYDRVHVGPPGGARKLIEDAPTISDPDWILCSILLPKEKGQYLTSTIFDETHCDYWDGVSWDRCEYIIAWRPLPPPYPFRGRNDNGNR